MKIIISQLRKLIREALITELGPIKGGLRSQVDKKRQQYKIGKIEDENKQLSTIEAEELFPGSTDAWVDSIHDMFPDFLFTDPFAIKKNTEWYKIGTKLRVSVVDLPGVELAQWFPEVGDTGEWFPMDRVPEIEAKTAKAQTPSQITTPMTQAGVSEPTKEPGQVKVSAAEIRRRKAARAK